jgi:hypothetical protein
VQDNLNYHKWSGWPGTFCLKCGAEDPWEYAIANDYYDPFYDKWDTKEHEEECLRNLICPVKED